MEALMLRSRVQEGANIYELPLRVAYYARVSTDKAEQLNSLDNQVYYYEEYIRKNPNWRFVDGYVDEGLSGTSTVHRLGFQRMIRDGKARRFDLLVTKEISRFARDTLDSIKYTRELLDHGVGVFFQSDNINTLTPDAELRLTIMASLAQEEVRKLSERLRFGYKRSIEQGRVLGQNNMLGYYKADGVLTVNEEQAAIVRRIFELYNEGKMGLRRIARELESEGKVSPFTGKMISPETIKSVITNPKYKGFYCSGKTISIDHRNQKRIRLPVDQWNVRRDPNIPAIVSEEVWDRANRLYQERSEMTTEHKDACQSRYSFSGKLVCGEHGTSYHRHVYKNKKHGDQEVWNCRQYRIKGRIDGCDSPTVYSKELFQILNDIYVSLYDQRDEIIDGLMAIYASLEDKDYSKDIAKTETEIDKIKTRKNALLDLVMDKTISKQEFAERNNALNAELGKLTAQLDGIREAERKTLNNKQNLKSLRKTLESEFDNPNSFDAEVTDALLDKIIINKIDGDKHRLRLEILLTVGKTFVAECAGQNVLSLTEIGISQAQVSRLEKGALERIKKQI